MTVLHRQENAPTWHLRCDRCGHGTWHEDAAQAPQAPHICSDGDGTALEHVAIAHGGHGGLFVHVHSQPVGALAAIVVVYALEDRLEVAISSWRMPCSVCGRMAGAFRAELMP